MILSIIIPTCNRIELLNRAVNSITAQIDDVKKFNVELQIVIVDDSNKEQVVEIKNAIKLDGYNIKVIRNTGPHSAANARNFGVRHCDGELVSFLDDDDIFLLGRFESMLSFYFKNKDKYSFISSGRLSEIKNFSKIELIRGQLFGEIRLSRIKYGNDIDIGFLVNKHLFERLGGFDNNLVAYEDWDLIIRLLMEKPGFKIQRLDYVVNNDEGRERVSRNESDHYPILGEKYRGKFGDAWYYRMVTSGLVYNNELTFRKSMCLSYKSMTFRPLLSYVRMLIPSL